MIVRLTAWIAMPRSLVDRRRDPEPGGEHVGPRLPWPPAAPRRAPRPASSSLSPVEDSRALVVDLLLGVDDADGILVPPEVDADRLREAQRAVKGPAAACVSIDIPCLRREMIGRRGGPGAPRVSGKPEKPKQPGELRGLRQARRRREARVQGLRPGRPGGPEAAPRRRARSPASRREKPPYRVYRSRPEPARPVPQAEPREPADRRPPEGGWRGRLRAPGRAASGPGCAGS